MLPPEPAVTTLGVMHPQHPQIHLSECYRAHSMRPYSGRERDLSLSLMAMRQTLALQWTIGYLLWISDRSH